MKTQTRDILPCGLKGDTATDMARHRMHGGRRRFGDLADCRCVRRRRRRPPQRTAHMQSSFGAIVRTPICRHRLAPNLIADMNVQKLAFTVHEGELTPGSGTAGSPTPTTCSDAAYVQAFGYLNALESAAMFTPGDND